MPLPPLPTLRKLSDDAEGDVAVAALNTEAVWLYLAKLKDALDGFTPSQTAAALDLGGLGWHPNSPLAGVTVPLSPPTPATPTGLTCTGFYRQIGLSWDLDPNPYIIGWEVQRADDLAFTVNVTTLTTSRSNVFVDPGPLADSTAYFYRVRSLTKDPANVSSFIAPQSATTLANDSTVVTQIQAAVLFVQRAHIQDAVINTAKIANASIIEAKIADASISTAKIQDLAVSTAKVDNLAVTTGKIANLAVTNAKVNDLSADKLTAGTITVLVKLSANQIELDGINAVINIYDTQGSPVKRIQLGKHGAGSTDYGLKVFSASGALMFDSNNSGATSSGILDSAVITAKINDLAVATGKLADLVATTVKIANNAINARTVYTTGALGYTTTSTTYNDTGATATLTTSNASGTSGNAVKVTAVCNMLSASTTGLNQLDRVITSIQLVRNGTSVREAGHAVNVQGNAAAPNFIAPVTLAWTDTAPAANTSYTYKIQGKVGNAVSSMTLDLVDLRVEEVIK